MLLLPRYGTVVIWAPHPDDEIIGCYTLLASGIASHVVFGPTSEQRRGEADLAAEEWGAKVRHLPHEFVQRDVHRILSEIEHEERERPLNMAPDHFHEAHPEHRKWGAMLLEASRMHAHGFGTYSTRMNAPYVRELNEADRTAKQQALDNLYPSQQPLWRFDHRFWLFEGQALWVV